MAQFPCMGFSNSPPPLMGVAQVALAQTRSLLVEEPCGGGSQDGCQVWRGAQVQPCSARPKQPVHEPEPSAVHFTYIFTWCSANSSLFHPWNEPNPPVLTWATKTSGSAGRTLWLWSDFCLSKQRLPWNVFQSSIISHKRSIKAPSSTYCNDHLPLHSSWVCLSNFHQLNNH